MQLSLERPATKEKCGLIADIHSTGPRFIPRDRLPDKGLPGLLSLGNNCAKGSEEPGELLLLVYATVPR